MQINITKEQAMMLAQLEGDIEIGAGALSANFPHELPTPSPYLPGTTIRYAWDSTCLSAFKLCPRYYFYTIVEGWTSKEESVHLRFGIEYHQALHDYELGRKAGLEHYDALFDTVRELLLRLSDYPTINQDAKPSIRFKSKENLLRTVIWYLDQFEDDPAETVEVWSRDQNGNPIEAPPRPAMEVSFKFELDWGPGPFNGHFDQGHGSTCEPVRQPYLLCGHLDRIVRFNDEIFVMDRKTTTQTLGDYYYAQFEPNNQMTLYTIAGQIVLGAPIRGVIIDAACIQAGGTVFGRRFTYRTQDQLDEWLRDLRETLASAERCATTGHWPMNDMSCSMYGGCRFREVCSKSPQVRENFLRSDFVQLPPERRWNPLTPRG